MRVFTDAVTMIEEIRRDLAKAPVVESARVQADEVKLKAHEAMNYAYSISSEALPEDTLHLAKLGSKYFDPWKSITQMVAWLAVEYNHRFQPLSKSARIGSASEEYHPLLQNEGEGGHYGYTYRERMIAMLPSMESVLAKDLYSRRAYWPIYEQRDSHRASDFTRIPCTLGYHFMVRDIALIGPQLHVTNLQRSCDFDKFWLSDLWFTACAQRLLAKRLEIGCGMIHHNILSFHAFIDQEVY